VVLKEEAFYPHPRFVIVVDLTTLLVVDTVEGVECYDA
jgi:hypothetical protein